MDNESDVVQNTVEFGQRVRDTRLRRGLSQARLATILGISHAALSRWENGNRNPNAEHPEKVLHWLKQ